ncbi:hypothetical protein ANN_23610 [Periplaneta americana]|uniref:Uncharacterized protein n=1 Tax=Periplaneta americana TaxID=6978 RepID=A0ABQ8SN09_PERAM|nr:hypothetical protein ANN_23610 [Periplaneta americana]
MSCPSQTSGFYGPNYVRGKANTLEELRQRITNAAALVTPQMPQNNWREVEYRRLYVCRSTGLIILDPDDGRRARAQELRQGITNAAVLVTPQMPQNNWRKVEYRRLDVCRATQGAHIELHSAFCETRRVFTLSYVKSILADRLQKVINEPDYIHYFVVALIVVLFRTFQVYRQKRFTVNMRPGIFGVRLLRPVTLPSHLNGATYLQILRNTLPKLMEDVCHMWFQYDGPTPHI